MWKESVEGKCWTKAGARRRVHSAEEEEDEDEDSADLSKFNFRTVHWE